MARDFLAEIIAERTKRNPAFPNLVAEAEVRRKIARRLAARREKKELSQTVVAARMGTSASVVSKLEAGGDVKLSTLQRYCAAIGEKLSIAGWRGPMREPRRGGGASTPRKRRLTKAQRAFIDWLGDAAKVTRAQRKAIRDEWG